MVTAIRQTDETVLDILGNNYQYDQLQRIKEMKAYYASGLASGNTFSGAALYRNPGSGTYNGQSAYQENYSFDRNGNLLTLKRNGSGKNDAGSTVALGMDNFTYSYYTDLINSAGTTVTNPTTTNRLAKVADAETSDPYAGDVGTGQISDNYRYNAIGQLVKDSAEQITRIEWTVTGKVKRIVFNAAGHSAGKKDLKFIYDPMDRRVAKQEYQSNAPYTWIKYTYYTYDAGGNVMAIYERETRKRKSGLDYNDDLSLADHLLYGSSRIGTETSDKLLTARVFAFAAGGSLEGTMSITSDVVTPQSYNWTHRKVKDKSYELSNHLGNVLAVVTDKKIPHPEELLYDEPFNSGTSNWGAYAWNGLPNPPAVTNTGGQLQVNASINAGGIRRYFNVTPGQTYTLSFDFACTTGTPVRLHRWDYTGTYASYTNYVYDDLTASGHYAFTFTATEEDMRIAFYTYSTNLFTLDNIQVSIDHHYTADVISYADYSPYGMLLQHRHGQETNSDYRYGFQGQEMDDEIKGEGNSINYEYRMHDPRIGRFFAVDPLAPKYPELTPYQFSSNSPIYMVELEGLEGTIYTYKNEGNGLEYTGSEVDPNLDYDINRTSHASGNTEYKTLAGEHIITYGKPSHYSAGQVNNILFKNQLEKTLKASQTPDANQVGGFGIYGGINISAGNGKIYEQINSTTVITRVPNNPSIDAEYNVITPATESRYLEPQGLYTKRCMACHSPLGIYNYAAYNSREATQGKVIGELIGIFGTTAIGGIGSIGIATKGGYSTIYRAVSQAELDDIAQFGLRMKSGGYETGKLFAPTLKEATQFGRYNFGLDGIPNTIIKVRVPNSVLNGATKFGADGMNAISIPANQLHLLKAKPLNYSPW